ncbi:semaphorin-4D isoform 1-T1 [Rhinophrynus dorsalis]
MAFYSLCVLPCLLLGAAAFGPVPRITWHLKEIHLTRFHVPEVFNYSTLLLSEDKDVLYVGAREVIFALNSLNIAEKQHEVYWKVSEKRNEGCARKGKSRQTECLNYIRVLQPLSETTLYVCGTNAFQPTCDYLDLNTFQLMDKNEDGRGRCPFDPAQSYTSVMVDGELYSGTSYTFLGSEPIICKPSQQGLIRTEYAVPWLNEPSFVSADVIRAPLNNPEGEDDKVYFFFTEVSVEYEFFSKLLIPRIARVCKSDQGGLRTLQKKWTSFLKAKLICHSPENNLIFNVVNDVFVLKSPNLREPVIYGVFTSHLNNVGLSAVCTYNVSAVEEVFSNGKYMQSATVEQSNTKWVRFNGEVPKPRPGACINNEARAMNYTSSLNLPDKTLQFVKDHPLMDDSVTPIGNKPRLVLRNVTYTQIVVDQVQALDGNTYDVMFISTDKGMLHKAVSHDGEIHIVEEIVLFPHLQPIQTLLLSNKKSKRFIYAGSNTGVVQSPVAFCEKFTSCVECILTRDPYCAWHPAKASCVNILQESNADRSLIQKLNGDASQCPDSADQGIQKSKLYKVKPGGMVELKCHQKSKLASVVWKFNNENLMIKLPKYHLLENALVILNVTEPDTGNYSCFSQELVMNEKFSQLLIKHVLELEKLPTPLVSTTQASTPTEAKTTTTRVFTIAMELSTGKTTTSTTQATTSVTVSNISRKTLTSTPSLVDILSNVPEVQVEKALYFTKSSDCSRLIFLILLFAILFASLLMYNCYKGFLPDKCLKFRSAMLPSKKKAPPNFKDCEQGLKENLVDQKFPHNLYVEAPKLPHDTGYETEPDRSNGTIPHKEDTEKTEEKEDDQPFDVKCDLKYADSDGD